MRKKILSMLLASFMLMTMLVACSETPESPDSGQDLDINTQEPIIENLEDLTEVLENTDGLNTYVSIWIGANGFDELYPKYIEAMKEAEVSRVFLCGINACFDSEDIQLYVAERFGKYAKIFESEGFEVAAWLDPIGHGGSSVKKFDSEYVYMESRSGKVNNDAKCPLGEKFVSDVQDYLQLLIKNGAKMIMLDDDYRMNIRSGEPYCFCEKHLELMSQYLGREVSAQDFSKIFVGAPSEERKAYMYAQGEGLKQMAQALREAIDEIDPTVRLGHCACLSTWDIDGVDSFTLAKIFAGKTKPFLRLIGAPYWVGARGCKNLSAIVQYERMQESWCEDENIEIFAEGDVYPRPRYVVPSSYLELFDLAVRASGGFDGVLKYMFNYENKYDYDTGYVAHHNRNTENRKWIEDHFDGKETLGLKLFEPMNTLEYSEQAYNLDHRCISPSLKFSAYNAVSSKFDGDGLTVIWGDSAWLATENELKDGAILDGVAAEILTRRGFDVGIIEFGEKFSVNRETYLGSINDSISLSNSIAYNMKISDSAEILSVLNGENVGSYTYTNTKGQKFLVYTFDGRKISEDVDRGLTGITGNYRKQQLFETIEKFGADVPLCKTDAPFLYMIARGDENEMSVFLMNAYEDSVLSPEVYVGDGYVRVEACNGTAELVDGKVVLSDISAYGFAAFTVYTN